MCNLNRIVLTDLVNAVLKAISTQPVRGDFLKGLSGKSKRHVTLVELFIISVLLVAAVLLRVDRLDTPSYTWDEVTDREIAFGYLLGRGITNADREPSQARFPIYVEALVIKYFSDSEAALRSISVVAGVLSLFAVRSVGARAFSQSTGLIAMALAACNPFHLLISRLSGTHGDALLALAYTLGLAILLQFWDRWYKDGCPLFRKQERQGLILFGIVAGIATGCKLTGALLLVNLLFILIADRKGWRHNWVWVGLVGLMWLTFFLLSSPIYMRWDNLLAAWQDQKNWEQIRGFHFMGKVYQVLPWWYWGIVIPIKFTIPFTIAAVFQIVRLLAHWRMSRPTQRLLLFNLFPLSVFVLRHWQSPTYATVLIGPLFALAAHTLVEVAQWARRTWHHGRLRWAALGAAIALLLVPAEYGRVIAVTHPDYLMTGYDFGSKFIGQFWGPAVYHCQGIGQALGFLKTQPPGKVLAPQACILPTSYYRIVYNLPEITFRSELTRPEDVLDYNYVLLNYTVTYMTAPYPLFQQTQVLREGLKRYCVPVYAYGVGTQELVWVYKCDP